MPAESDSRDTQRRSARRKLLTQLTQRSEQHGIAAAALSIVPSARRVEERRAAAGEDEEARARHGRRVALPELPGLCRGIIPD